MFLIQKWGATFSLQLSRFRAVFLSGFLSRTAVVMGCVAGCASSNVYEPELKGFQGYRTMASMGPLGPELKMSKGPKVQHHKMHNIKHKQQRKADLVQLESKTSKTMMTEDPPFRSIFEGWFHSWCHFSVVLYTFVGFAGQLDEHQCRHLMIHVLQLGTALIQHPTN